MPLRDSLVEAQMVDYEGAYVTDDDYGVMTY